MTQPTFRSRLRNLALALLNATLMLAVLLVFGAFLLLGRVQDFAADTMAQTVETVGVDVTDRMAAQAAEVSAVINQIKDVDVRLKASAAAADSATAEEIAGLRADVQGLTGALDGLREEARDGVVSSDVSVLLDQMKEIDLGLQAKAAALDTATAGEIAGLRTDVQALTGILTQTRDGVAGLRETLGQALRTGLKDLLIDIANRIDPIPPTN